MRILHVLDHSIPLHSGYTFRTRAILKEQNKLGWETYHLTSPKHSIEAKTQVLDETVDGLKFYRTTPPDGMLANIPVINQLLIVRSLENRLTGLLQEIKPDIVHSHSPSLNGEAAVNAAKRMGIPVVYEVRAFWEDAAVDHGTTKENSLRYRLTKMMETSVLKRADAITTICEGLRNDIIGRGIDSQKVTVIANAVNLDVFKKLDKKDQDIEQQLGLDGKIVLGFIGSFYAYEGLPLLLEAVAKIPDSEDKLRVLLVGGGPQENNLKKLTEQLNLADKVIFTGRVPHDDVQKYYSVVDLLVYPRYSMRLTELVTPLKPIEAMAQHKLVIASDVGGHKEIITDGENGFLFKSGDVNSLAACIQETLRNKDSWSQIKEQARKYVEEHRTWPGSVSHYKKVYSNILNNCSKIPG